MTFSNRCWHSVSLLGTSDTFDVYLYFTMSPLTFELQKIFNEFMTQNLIILSCSPQCNFVAARKLVTCFSSFM